MTTVPFTDVSSSFFFCQIAEAYFSGLTNGTSATTYSPNDPVPREQMAAFITRTQDSALRRGSRRAALGQWATTVIPQLLPVDALGGELPVEVKSDGEDVWIALAATGRVGRFHASDGTLLGFWTGATSAWGVLVFQGNVWVTGTTSPGNLYAIRPQYGSGPGPVATVSSSLGINPLDITADGRYIWTANQGDQNGAGGGVSLFDPATGAATNITTGFTEPVGILYDGANIWVTDVGDNTVKKLDAGGKVLQSLPVVSPQLPVFDGSNIWVPNNTSNSVTVVRVRDGMVLATLTGNGLNGPVQAAFDGQRIVVTNKSGHSVSLWNATSLTSIGSVPVANPNAFPFGVCSDGISFWIALQGLNRVPDLLARF
jgi:hypothetical protein